MFECNKYKVQAHVTLLQPSVQSRPGIFQFLLVCSNEGLPSRSSFCSKAPCIQIGAVSSTIKVSLAIASRVDLRGRVFHRGRGQMHYRNATTKSTMFFIRLAMYQNVQVAFVYPYIISSWTYFNSKW